MRRALHGSNDVRRATLADVKRPLLLLDNLDRCAGLAAHGPMQDAGQ